MLFYEDIIKEVENTNIETFELKKIEKFGLNFQKQLSGYGISIPLLMIGLFQIYSYTIYHKWYLLLFGIVFFWIGLKHFKNIFTYRIFINTVDERIKSGKLDSFFSNINSIELKETKIGSKVIPVLDMISNERKQIIIPLYMNKLVRFINVVRKLNMEKFKIIK